MIQIFLAICLFFNYFVYSQNITPDVFLGHVEENHPWMKSLKSSSEAFESLAVSLDEMYDPVLFADLDHKLDQTPSIFPQFEGVRRNYTTLGAGVRKHFAYGIDAELGVGVMYRHLQNATLLSPNYFWQQSLNASIQIPLLKNWKGELDLLQNQTQRTQSQASRLENQFKVRVARQEAMSSYWAFVISKEEFLIRTSLLKQAKELHAYVQGRVQLSLLEKQDLLAALAGLQKRELDLDVAKNHLEKSLLALRYWDNSIDINSKLEPASLHSLLVGSVTFDSSTMPTRADIESKKILLQSFKEQLELEKKKYDPSLSLQFSASQLLTHVSGNNGTISCYYDPTCSVYALGLKFELPVSSRSRRAAVSAKQSQVDAQRFALDSQEQEVKRDFLSQMNELASMKVQHQQAKKILNTLELRSIEIKKNRSLNRTGTLEYVRAEQELGDARVTELMYRFELWKSHSVLQLYQERT